jgi:O-antigen/teichoic acid export membrane protein
MLPGHNGKRSRTGKLSKAKSSIFLSAASLFGLGLNFLALPWLIRWIGVNEFGLFGYLQVIALYVGLIDLGYTHGAVKRMTEAFGRGDREQAWLVQRCLLTVHIRLGLIGFGILALISVTAASSPGLAGWLFPPGTSGVYQRDFLLVLIGGSFLLGAVSGALAPVFIAAEKFQSMAVRDAVQRIVSLAAGLWAAYTYGTLFAYILASTLGTITGFLFNFFTLKRSFADFRLRPGYDKEVFRDLKQIGVRSYVHRIGSMMANSIHKPLMAQADSAAMIARYELASRVPEAIKAIVDPVSQTVLPQLTREAATDSSAFARSVERYSMIGLGLGVSLILVPAGFGLAILKVWAGNNPAVTPVTDIVLLLAAVYFTFELFYIMLTKAFYALGNMHLMAPFSIFNGVATLLLTVPMVRNFGLVGVAVQNVAIDLVQLVPILLVVRRHAATDLRVWSQAVNVLIAVGIGAGIAVGAFYMMRLEVFARSPWLAIALIPVFSAATFFLLVGLRLTPLPEDVRKLLRR